jgi:proliferating cell nuclear antigen
MKGVITDSTIFKGCVDAVVNLVEEGVFCFTDEGVRLRAMDPSQISMVSLFIPKSVFSQYEVEGEVKLGLNITYLSNVLSRCKKDEQLELWNDETHLIISLKGEKRSRTFKLKLLDLGEGLQKEPTVPHNAHVRMSVDALKQVLKDAHLMSPYVQICTNAQALLISVKADHADMVAEFSKDAPEIALLECDGVVKETFNLEYLEDMLKACPSSELVDLYLGIEPSSGKHLPIKIEYSIGGAKIVYYLAPRIDES